MCVWSCCSSGPLLKLLFLLEFGLQHKERLIHDWSRELDSHKKDTSVAFIFLPHIYSFGHNAAIDRTHNRPPLWMNATVLFTTLHPFTEGGTKRWKIPPVPRIPSQHQSARSPPSAVFTLQWVPALQLSWVCSALVWSTTARSPEPLDRESSSWKAKRGFHTLGEFGLKKTP